MIFAVYVGSSLFEGFRCKSFSELKDQQKLNLAQQEELNQVTRLAEIGQISAGVSHEINTPLMIIQYSTEIIENYYKNPGTMSEVEKENFSKLIDHSCNRIADIIRDFRAASEKSVELDSEAINTRELLKEVSDSYENKVSRQNVDFSFTVGKGAELAYGNKQEIREVIHKIIDNGIDAVKNTSEKKIKIRVAEDRTSGAVKFTITDSGAGIPVENESKVFTPFFTTKEIGSAVGLGLAVSHGIIVSHGGKIYVDREAETSSAISFTIDKNIESINSFQSDPTD